MSLTTDAPPSSRPETPSVRRLWIAALTAGVVGGAVGWLGGEAIHGLFLPPVRTVSGADAAEDVKSTLIGLEKEANVAFALLGGAVGLTLGLAGGVSRRSAGGAAVAAVAGLVLGTAAAFGAAFPLIAIASQNVDRINDDMVFSILLLGGIASAIGLSGGLAFGIGWATRAGSSPRPSADCSARFSGRRSTRSSARSSSRSTRPLRRCRRPGSRGSSPGWPSRSSSPPSRSRSSGGRVRARRRPSRRDPALDIRHSRDCGTRGLSANNQVLYANEQARNNLPAT